jgi:putative oxidoreductase
MLKQTASIAAFGRFLIALIFIVSGVGKITTPTAVQSYIAAAGLPVPLAAYVIAIVVEVGGGILLILGFQTRIIALAMAIFTVATAAAFHRNFTDPDQMMHFLKNISMTGGLLQVVAFGAGAFSIDRRRAPSGNTLSTAMESLPSQ